MQPAPITPDPRAELPDTGAALFGRADAAKPAPKADSAWTEPIFDPSLLEISYEDASGAPGSTETAPIQAAEPTGQLQEAIPTGDSFDDGVASLLKPPAEKTASGLVKRDKGTSQAPVSEGRAVAASVRSPEEIRSMLARYRDGLKGRPAGAQSSDSPRNSLQNNSLQNNPHGEQS